MCLPFSRSPLACQTHTSAWSPSAHLALPPSTGETTNKDKEQQHINSLLFNPDILHWCVDNGSSKEMESSENPYSFLAV